MISAGTHPTRRGGAPASASTAVDALPARVSGGHGAWPMVTGLEAFRLFGTTRVALGAAVLVGLGLRLSAVGFGHDWLTFQPDEDANIPIALGLS